MNPLSLRIAMWSGPRNISTAMMRSWENRPDCFVCDEPLYAFYLKQTGLDHPGRAETIEQHESDWKKVSEWLTGPIPDGKSIWYQKHMAHHLLPEIDRNWLDELTNCFLIRDPREMLTSLIEFIPNPRVEDTGLPQQVELFQRIADQSKTTPAVLDSKDVLQNPQFVLKQFCDRIGIRFEPSMLGWPPGLRETDGAWAPFWYDKVKITTEFANYRSKEDQVPEQLQYVFVECTKLYEQLYPFRIC